MARPEVNDMLTDVGQRFVDKRGRSEVIHVAKKKSKKGKKKGKKK